MVKDRCPAHPLRLASKLVLCHLQDAVFCTVAAVLHLGNLTFVDAGDEAAAVEAGTEEHLEGEWRGITLLRLCRAD